MKNRFGQRLSAYRDYVGETQEQLANAINVKLRTLQTWEQGIHNCSFDDLMSICDHYQITADYLIGNTPDDSPATAKCHRDILSFEERKALVLFEEYLLSKHKK